MSKVPKDLIKELAEYAYNRVKKDNKDHMLDILRHRRCNNE